MQFRGQSRDCSHLHGRLAPIEAIENWAQSRGVALVEDACQVPGATIGNRTTGSFGDVSVLSFGGSKLLTAGRGGALLTCREDIYQRAKIFGHRGNDAFPLSQIQATVLLPQLEVLAERNRRRGQAVEFLLQQSEKWSGLQAFPSRAEDAQPSYYKLGWLYTGDTLEGPSRELFLRALQSEGLAIDSGFRGFAQRSERRCRRSVPLPFSERAAKSTVLMHHPILLADQSTLRKSPKRSIKYTLHFLTESQVTSRATRDASGTAAAECVTPPPQPDGHQQCQHRGW